MENYSIIKFISQGSFGKVYLISSKKTNQKLIMKRIKLINLHHYDKENIFNEIKLSLFHDCPYLLKTNDVFLKENNICLVSKYYEKNTLENIIYHSKLSPDKILYYFSQLLLAVNYLHQYNIIHRDIKTSNIFIDKDDHLVLGDFGISKILPQYKILTGTQVGTPYYLSPELAKGVKYSNSSDIWSLGVVLYEMIYQKKPFKSHNMVGLLHKIKYENVSFLPNYQYQNLINLCTKLLNKKEIERPSTKIILTQNEIYDTISKNNFKQSLFQKDVENKLHLCHYNKLINFQQNFNKIKENFLSEENLKNTSTQTNISIPFYKSYI